MELNHQSHRLLQNPSLWFRWGSGCVWTVPWSLRFYFCSHPISPWFFLPQSRANLCAFQSRLFWNGRWISEASSSWRSSGKLFSTQKCNIREQSSHFGTKSQKLLLCACQSLSLECQLGFSCKFQSAGHNYLSISRPGHPPSCLECCEARL